jgi:acetoin utilization deacetylase AcuC-like enzyme
MILYYSDDYTLASHSFDTTRKARWIAESLRARPIAGVELVAPAPVTQEQLLAAHDAAYVDAVRTGEPRELAESQGFVWDPLLWTMVCASTGGVIAAARDARRDGVAGSLSSGLHHARRAHGAGYCTFNGLALAALDALAQGARSVLVLDLDAHCGGGTHSLLAHDPRVQHADIAVSDYDRYLPEGAHRLTLVENAARYLPAIERMLSDLERDEPYDLCLYNAGMDPYQGCDIGGLAGVTHTTLTARERLVFQWLPAHTRAAAFVLAGGYTGRDLSQDQLVALHRLTIEAASEAASEAATSWPGAKS